MERIYLWTKDIATKVRVFPPVHIRIIRHKESKGMTVKGGSPHTDQDDQVRLTKEQEEDFDEKNSVQPQKRLVREKENGKKDCGTDSWNRLIKTSSSVDTTHISTSFSITSHFLSKLLAFCRSSKEPFHQKEERSFSLLNRFLENNCLFSSVSLLFFFLSSNVILESEIPVFDKRKGIFLSSPFFSWNRWWPLFLRSFSFSIIQSWDGWCVQNTLSLLYTSLWGKKIRDIVIIRLWGI